MRGSRARLTSSSSLRTSLNTSLEAGVVRLGSTVKKRQGTTYDDQGDDQPCSHGEIVGGPGNARLASYRSIGRAFTSGIATPIPVAAATREAVTRGSTDSRSTTLYRVEPGVPLRRNNVNGLLRSTMLPTTVTNRLHAAPKRVRPTIARMTFSALVRSLFLTCATSPKVSGSRSPICHSVSPAPAGGAPKNAVALNDVISVRALSSVAALSVFTSKVPSGRSVVLLGATGLAAVTIGRSISNGLSVNRSLFAFA